MSLKSRAINTLRLIFNLSELAQKVDKAENDILEMDSRIDTRMDKSWKETDARIDKFWKDVDARIDSEKSKASAGRSELKESVAYLRGTIDEINRKRHAVE